FSLLAWSSGLRGVESVVTSFMGSGDEAWLDDLGGMRHRCVAGRSANANHEHATIESAQANADSHNRSGGSRHGAGVANSRPYYSTGLIRFRDAVDDDTR